MTTMRETSENMTSPAQNNRVYLTEQERARQLQISMATARRLRRKGQMPPAIRVGNLVRYEVRACDLWASEQASR